MMSLKNFLRKLEGTPDNIFVRYLKTYHQGQVHSEEEWNDILMEVKKRPT